MTNATDVVAGTNATATQYNNLRKDTVLGVNQSGTESIVTTTSTIDWSLTTKGKIRKLSLTVATTTLVFSNVTVDQSIILRLAQDGTGGRTVVWPSGIIWANGVVPVLSTGASKIDTFGLICTSAGNYDGYLLGNNMG